MKRILFVTLLALVALGLSAEPAEGAERVKAIATRTSGPIRVDGVLDEPDWERAPPITAFRRIFVSEGEVPSESTEVRVLYDSERVYFGIWCGNQHAGSVRASLAPRDQILDDDHISIHLDTYHDLHRAYIFGVNPYGVQLDGILVGQDPDFTWDGVWDAETRRAPDGWTAEVAIPLRSLRFPSQGAGTWGLWMRRAITKDDEVCSWPLWRQENQGDIMLQAGDLEGLAGLRGGGETEIEPYAASLQSSTRTYDANADAYSPWSDHSDFQGGLDLRRALTTSLTANVTINPDYSQVEADAVQIDVNKRFPLFYPEKRPFFLDGADVFTTPIDLVYTRRIADPGYGGKLTGKQGRWRVGAIALFDDGGGSTAGIGARENDVPSMRGYFGIGRVSYDIGDNNSVGGLVTYHRRDSQDTIDGEGFNVVGAADTRFRLGPSLFFTGQFAQAHTQMDSLGPSASRTRFSDLAYNTDLKWADGVRYLDLYRNDLGAKFRAETGYLERVDVVTTGYEANYTFRPENRWLRSWEPQSNGDVIRDHDGTLQEWQIAGAIDWSFQQQTHLQTRMARVRERWLSREYDRNRYILVVDNTLYRPLAVSFDMTLEDGIDYGPTDAASFLGWQETYNLAVTVRPSPRLSSELTGTRERLSRSYGGEEIYDIWALGAKTTYQFSRRLYARLYPQYDTGLEHLDADALLGFVLHPGTVLYLGVGGDVDKVGSHHRPTQHTVFLKASYLFRT